MKKLSNILACFKSAKGRQIICSIAACIGAFGLGTVLGWSSPVMTQLFNEKHLWGHSGFEEVSWIGALGPAGAVFAGPIAGILAKKVGRKTTMLILSAPFVLGFLLITYAKSFVYLYIGRIITGFCGGASTLTVPIYISETAQKELRGHLVSLYQLFLTIGIVFSYILGVSFSWRYSALVCAFVPLIFLVIIIFIPETPHYLVKKGQVNEALASLTWLRGDLDSKEVQAEFDELQETIDLRKGEKIQILDIFKIPNRKPILICLALIYFQQLSGINAVIFYTFDIFDRASTGIDGNTQLILVGTAQFLVTFLAVLLIEKVGRKKLLILSGSFMGIFLALLGCIFKFQLTLQYLSLISVLLFIISYSMGYGSVSWVIVSEILPTHIKEYAYALIACFNWTIVFLITKFAPQANEFLQFEVICWFFSANSFLGCIFVYFCVPQTGKKSLGEIQTIFDKKL